MKTLKTLNFDFYFRKRYLFATPCVQFGYSKNTPFADWCIDFDVYFIFWGFSMNIDNMYKYYPKYKAECKK